MPTTYFLHSLCHRKFVTIGVNKYFLHKLMTLYAVHYDFICHPFPINSQYLRMWGVDSPGKGNSKRFFSKSLAACFQKRYWSYLHFLIDESLFQSVLISKDTQW